MPDVNGWEEIKRKIKTIIQWIVSSFLDAVFLVCWIVIQWFVNQKIIANLNLSGIDEWMLITFQVLFSIATLIPVIAYIGIDVCKVILRSWAQIQQERFLLQELRQNKFKSLSSKKDNSQLNKPDSSNTEGQSDDSQNI